MTQTVFCSGFAGPEALFPGLSGRTRFVAPFLDGDEAFVLGRLMEGGDVLAGWSTGAHLILKHATALFPRYGRVVLFAPFLRFADCYPLRAVRAMAAGMAADPAATIAAFWQNCAVDAPPAYDPAWTGALAAGLDYLLASEAAVPEVAAGHATVVSGAADRIVRASAVDKVLAALPAAAHVVHPGGHWPRPALVEGLLWP
jgi:hypothetical protein